MVEKKSFRLHVLKKRADFLRARKGRYCATSGLVLQVVRTGVPVSVDQPDVSSLKQDHGGAREASNSQELLPPPRFGFTATKKLGNAVVRNRVKRRLREAVRQIAPQKARTGYDYVLIGRKSTLKRPFSCLLQDLTRAFTKVHAVRGRGAGGQGRRGGRKKAQDRAGSSGTQQ